MKPKSATVMGILIMLTLTVQAWAGRPIPDTGQTQCYDGVGGAIACPGTGQDGTYTINPMSFTKLDATGNDLPDDAPAWEMVRDNVTGLIWEVKQNKNNSPDYTNPHDADNTYTWYDPNPETNGGMEGTESANDTVDFIMDLNGASFGGHNDWRMPTREELRLIEDYSRYNPTIKTIYFPNTVSSLYWSSSTYANGPDRAWVVYFGYGDDSYFLKSDGLYVRAVRGGQSRSLDHLVINDADTVTDRKTGLMWQRATDGLRSWADASIHCEGMTIAGHNDWRLPTVKELSSIADLGQSTPAIDQASFPGTFSSDYWSSSTNANTPDDAWVVYFYNGSDSYNLKSNDLYVRAVRGGQSRALGHLVILEPRQASCWDIGSVMPITWDPGDVPETEQVEITLSRTGGGGTLQQIAVTENDGYHEWKVSGLASWNGWLEITPTSPTWESKATGVGMFSLQDYIVIDNKNPIDLVISETPGANTATFRIRLTQTPVPDTEVKIRLYSGNTGQCTVSPTIVVFDESHLTATVTVTAVDDALIDGDHVVTIRTGRIESTDPDYRDMAAPTVDVTIQDDEVPPVLTVDSVQPNMAEVNQPITLSIKGTGLSPGVVTNALLVLQKEDESPDWNHLLDASNLIPMGTELVAYFPAADTIGQYILRIVHDTGYEEVKGAVTVAESSVVEDMQGKKAIIVAGRENATDALWISSMNNANRAYSALRFQGFSGENIQYLTHMANMDVDGDGELDKDGDPTHAALQSAVTTWAADAEELIIYMVDHGGEELFHLDYGDHITADELKTWLDGLQQTRAMRVIVIVDACMSGSFLNGLAITDGVHAQSERVVIAGAGPNEPAWFQNEGGISFSRYFWDTAYMTGRLFRSYIYGRDHMIIQHPLADRDGNGSADEITLVGLFNDPASEILIGRGRIAASTPPEIGGICDDQTIGCESTATITASDIVFYNGELSVIAQLLPPTYDDEPSDKPVEELPTIKLTKLVGPDQKITYTGAYEDFSRTGVYRILVFATDKKDVTSVPKITRVTRTCGATNVKADLNKDTRTNLTDAVIALKILAGTSVTGLRTDYTTAGVDVDDNNNAGMAEAIFALQKAAELR